MALEGGYILADTAAITGNDCGYEITLDGQRFPYHTSVDVPLDIIQPKYDEDGRLEEFGYIVVGLLVEGKIFDERAS